MRLYNYVMITKPLMQRCTQTDTHYPIFKTPWTVKVKMFPPWDIAGVRRLLGLLGYFRRHIESFQSVAGPLYDLLIKLVYRNKPVVNKS